MSADAVRFRPLAPTDSMEELTALLHRAYAPLAAQGMRFYATHQPPEVTARRAAEGECWVGLAGERLVATVTVTPPGRCREARGYARPGVAKLGQMGVDPERKGQGLGGQLLALAEERARALGADELALDTAVHALDLHRTYLRRGYRFVEMVDWRPHVNYLSVLLSLDLRAAPIDPRGGSAPLAPPGIDPRGGSAPVAPPGIDPRGGSARTCPGWARAPDDAWNDRADAVWRVFAGVWPRLPARLARAHELGWRWTEVSTAFLVDELAHVGVLEVAALFDGVSVPVAGVHAVGTHPDGRGRGLGEQALVRALRHVDERVGTAYLTTTIPEYFARHGFRVVPEHRFRVPRPVPTGGATPLRPLSDADPRDREVLARALDRRAPASQRLAVEERGWFLGIDELIAHGRYATLHAADDLGVVVAWQRNGDRAEILDVIGPELPPFAEIAARLPSDLAGIDVLFCPDRLDAALEPVPGAPDDTVLMVRGDWPIAGPVCLPVHARC